MTPEEARPELVRLLIERADEALDTARRERMLSPAAAINRAYYAAFYAASAVMAAEGRHFVKHTGLRAALHRHLVKPGRLPTDLGREFDALLEARQIADYTATVEQTTEKADVCIAGAERLVAALVALLPPGVR